MNGLPHFALPQMALPQITSEVAYLALIFGLLVGPRVLQRWLIPAPITSFVLGMVAAAFLPQFAHDATLVLLSTLGISSLFLVAGLEVDVHDLRKGMWALAGHLAVRIGSIGGSAWLAVRWLGVSWQIALLLALALLTPSTGFILDTLGELGLNEGERFWVTLKAIGGEVLALLALFVVLQSGSPAQLALSSAALLAMVVFLPLLLLLLGRRVVPHAPGSAFSLLVMVGLIAAYLTKQLGVYYLVGAFLAGFTARLLRERVPELATAENLHAVRLFASFFIPFYFFHGGMSVPSGALVWESLWLGCGCAAIVLPLRIAIIWPQQRLFARKGARSALHVGVALAPTLIFTLVIATILHERFALPDVWYGALLVYAGLSTLLPALVLSRPFDIDVVGPALPKTPAVAPAASAAVAPEAEPLAAASATPAAVAPAPPAVAFGVDPPASPATPAAAGSDGTA